jgi:Ni/Co efflux regulator RcnB
MQNKKYGSEEKRKIPIPKKNMEANRSEKRNTKQKRSEKKNTEEKRSKAEKFGKRNEAKRWKRNFRLNMQYRSETNPVLLRFAL